MQADPNSGTPTRRNFIPVIVLVVVVGSVLFFTRGKNISSGMSAPLSNSITEYSRLADRAKAITHDVLAAYDSGERLTVAQLAELQKGAAIYDQMAELQPQNILPAFLGAKCYQIVGQDQEAERRYLKVLANRPNNADPKRAKAAELTIAEANFQLSTVYLRQNHYPEALARANEAIKVVPNSAEYYTARAQAEIQLSKLPEAKSDLEKAIKLRPQLKLAQSLLKFINGAA